MDKLLLSFLILIFVVLISIIIFTIGVSKRNMDNYYIGLRKYEECYDSKGLKLFIDIFVKIDVGLKDEDIKKIIKCYCKVDKYHKSGYEYEEYYFCIENVDVKYYCTILIVYNNNIVVRKKYTPY